MGVPPDTTDDDLSQYDPILLAVGIRAPKYAPLQQTSPASKSTLRVHRGDALRFGKNKPRKRLGTN